MRKHTSWGKTVMLWCIVVTLNAAGIIPNFTIYQEIYNPAKGVLFDLDFVGILVVWSTALFTISLCDFLCGHGVTEFYKEEN